MHRLSFLLILGSIGATVNSSPHSHRHDLFRPHSAESSEEVRYYSRTPVRRISNNPPLNSSTAASGNLNQVQTAQNERPVGEIPNRDPVYPPVGPRPEGGYDGYKPSDPNVINRVNSGVGTILNGVGSARLSEILRGSFMFTRNENVRSVANTVLDSIFGPRDEAAVQRNKNGVAPLSGL